jgi:hypothetical protein
LDGKINGAPKSGPMWKQIQEGLAGSSSVTDSDE